MIHQISAGHLTQDKIEEIILNGYQLTLSEETRKRIIHCREYLDRKIAESDKPIYGVTTGFGSLCKISINEDQLAQLQINLMMSAVIVCLVPSLSIFVFMQKNLINGLMAGAVKG